jgi:hypothetical protein
VVKVGFSPDNLFFNESDGEVEVCVTILSPLELLDAGSFLIIFTIYTIPGTAQNPDDYKGVTFEEALANPAMAGLTAGRLEACTSISIVNDTVVGEGPETFQLNLEFSPSITNVNVVGCPANVTILDRRMCIL